MQTERSHTNFEQTSNQQRNGIHPAKMSKKQKSGTRWLHRGTLQDMSGRAHTYSSPMRNKRNGRNTTEVILGGQQYHSQKGTTTKDTTTEAKKKKGPMLQRNTPAKILKEIACLSNQYMKAIIHHTPVGFLPGLPEWVNLHTSINGIYHINRGKDKNNVLLA